MVTALKEYRGVSKLKQEAMNVLVKMCDEEMLSHLRSEFERIDEDNSGSISVYELKSALNKAGSNLDW